MDLEFVCTHAGRPASALTRRDVARALLAVPSGVALVALPELRRALMGASNPLSAMFWDSAKATLGAIESGVATVGDVQHWLEATGTEPILLTRSFYVWPEEDERGETTGEMYDLLVAHLEGRVVVGEIDPDALAAEDPAARLAYEDLQERWLVAPLPGDGRVPLEALTDEQEKELEEAWDEEEAYALSELRRVVGELPEPPLPERELHTAAARLREMLTDAGYPGSVLRACAGFEGEALPDDDTDLWLAVAAGVSGPISDLPEEDDTLEEFVDLDGDVSHEDSVLAALCAIHHADWLAAVTALARRGPGVLASAERIARLIAESDDVEADVDPDDVEATEMLFMSVTPLWAELGIIDRDQVLTPLGWWGLPKALERAWNSGD
ncbi:hypothetical protein C1I98_30830 [Spongiactinospora gelatinilytica]|uniref:Uncharacterized protein n=1 Tax=Spongiactinospora gelatinilytica TaxID=2666298 RepID=A0A2W2G0E8_9ACTN|nr:hypothetical protein [Spongiactinospora gelatinilytica]PZG30860.1 hypothetical protein C1I98_30830 [Spongiactinospora gelatinilytica]